MKTVAMMNAVSNMDHSKPTWKVSWLRRWRLLLVTFCLLDLSNGIQFRKSPNKESFRQRSDLDLVCSDTLYPKIVIISKKGGEILLNKTSHTKQWTFTASHKINNIQCDQMGVYECEVLHYGGTKTSETLDVFVDYCAQLRVSPQGDIIKPGDDVSMTCIGVNYPNMLAISKRGEHDRFNLSSKSSRQFIFDVRHQINNIKCEQMGVYECRGLFHGDKSHESLLNVGNSSYCKTLISASKTEDAQPTDNKDCEEGWKFYSNTCVKGYGSEEKMTWTSAVNECKNQNSKLIGEKAAEIVAFLNDVLDVNAIWINERKRNKCTVQVKSNNANKAIECNKFRAFVCFKPADGSVTRKTTIVTPTTTALKPECPQMDLSKCPGGWFPMRDNTCMKVETAKKHYYDATDSCNNYGGSLVDYNLDDVTKACILEQSENDPDESKMIWLQFNYLLNVQTKNIESTSPYREHPYACSIQNYVPLSIPFFNLTVFPKGSNDQHEQDINTKVHQFSQSYENVEKGNEFRFECEARGTPVPDLSVYKDGEEVRTYPQRQKLNTTAVTITYNTTADRCGELGTFSCNASNVFGNLSSFGNVQIRVPCPTKIIKFETPRQSILPGQKAEIKCITESYPWQDITLYRNDTGEELAYINTFDKSQQLIYTIENVRCSDMGLYECVAERSGDPQRNISQLAVHNCPPQLCPGEHEKKMISAAVGETKTVSICVISYPDLRQFWLNETRIYSGLKDPKFDVHYNRTDRSSLYYTINVTIKNITQGDYGTLRIEMSTSYSKKTEYRLQIQPEGSPQLCQGESKLKTILAEVGETKTVSICVIAYPGIDSVRLNGIRIYRQETDSKFDVDYSPTELKSLYYAVNITVKAVTPTDYGLLRVDILTTEMEEMNYILILKPKEKPRITSFQITIINGQYNTSKKGITYQTKILSTDFLVMKINDLFLNFTCQASGILLSEVEIVESVTDKTQVSHGVPFTYQKPPGACGAIASFACEATNTFGDSGKSKTIGILAECPSKIVEFQEHSPDVPYNSCHKQILTCKAKGYPPPDLLLSKLGVDVPLTSTLGQNILNYTWPKTQCENMGTYKCQSTNQLNKEPVWQTFDLRVRGCSPQLCPWESASKTVYLETGDTKSVSICLVSSTVLYPHDTVAVNGIMFDNGQDNGKFLVEYQADEENDMYYNVNLTVKSISMDDYGQLSVKIWSHYQTETEWSSNSLEYNITLNKEEHQDFVGELIVEPVEEDIVDAVGEIPVSVSESQVDYVGENLDMWETLQTESKCQKIEELFTTAKKWLDKVLGIDLCKTPHSSRMRMEGLWTEFINVMYLVNCV